MSWKPEGYTSAAPYLTVRDAEATLALLEAVFGATRLRVIPRPGGGIMHAEARIDDTVVMMGEAPEGPEAHVHVYVPDVDAVWARAMAAGGEIVQAPERKTPDDDRRGGFRDPNGVTWWIASA
jgi:PhnB protein